MSLSPTQIVTLKAAIAAQTDPTFVGYRTSGATGAMAEWYNGIATPAQLVWRTSVPASDSDEASNWSEFDNITQAGKRDSWGYFFNFPRDFSRNKVRKWITDVWGSATTGSNAEAILLAGTRNATRGEVVFGGTSATTGTVTALKLAFEGSIRNEDIVAALGS
jgi:hypothetical protein